MSSVSPLALLPFIVVKQHKSKLIQTLAFRIFVMRCARAVAAAGVLARIAHAADFDWSAIEPSEQLKYHPCYDGYLCARLSVPYV